MILAHLSIKEGKKVLELRSNNKHNNPPKKIQTIRDNNNKIRSILGNVVNEHLFIILNLRFIYYYYYDEKRIYLYSIKKTNFFGLNMGYNFESF